MALKPCPECGAQISAKAKACPQCGHTLPKPTSRLSLALAGLVLFSILYGIANQPPDAAQAPKTAADLEREKTFQRVVSTVRQLKAAMKNPESFQLVSATQVQGPTLCLVYRSTNSFNATVTEQYTLNDKVRSTSASAWNQHCANRQGEDFSHARAAL